jgi:hypothetical protein
MRAKLAVGLVAVGIGLWAMPALAGTDGTISTGYLHYCGVKTDGHLHCWGLDFGGDVTGPNASTETYREVGVGAYFSCALKTNGHMQCWGAPPLAGVEVSGPNASTDTFTQISAGYDMTCGLKTDGHLECWGVDSGYGEITSPNASTETFSQVAASQTATCAVKADGHLECWGRDNYGQISAPNASTDTFLRVAGASNATCGLKTDHRLWCGGLANDVTNAANASMDLFSQMDGGSTNLCGVKLDGHLECWGYDQWNQVSGPNASSATYLFVSTGGYDTCALRTDLHMQCWGPASTDALAGWISPDTYQSPDATPPVLTAPDVTANATTPTGANVAFDVTASDPDDAAGPVTCDHASGSFFPIGSTSVSCQSTDTHGNTGYATFAVTVLGAGDQLQNLQASLAGLGGGSFSSQVGTVLGSLGAGQTATACNQLSALARHVAAQSGKQLTVAQADAALADVARIEAVVGC